MWSELGVRVYNASVIKMGEKELMHNVSLAKQAAATMWNKEGDKGAQE